MVEQQYLWMVLHFGRSLNSSVLTGHVQCPPRKSPSARKKSVEGRGLQATSHLVLVEQDSFYCYADISVAESESGNNSL